MSNVWFCSDLHLGHKNIGKFRAPLVNSEEANNSRILAELNKYVTKRDVLFVLGDWCFDANLIEPFMAVPAYKKYIIRGNHDRFPIDVYTMVFDNVEGFMKYKGFWLSHAPIHPGELRGRPNLHGHVHYSTVEDERYFNCCPENLWPKYGRCLVSLDEIRQHFSN